MTYKEKVEFAVQKFLNGEGLVITISKNLDIPESEIISELLKLGYSIKSRTKLISAINQKKAVEEYIANFNNKPSLAKISKKYNVGSKSVSDRLKELGYEIVNHQNKLKFDETIFDSIDTEEKAYWLGFIFADGYVSGFDSNGKNDYYFEISLKGDDKKHLDKFNIFMKHEDLNHVKINKAECFNTSIICDRCRWSIRNKHLWETLNSYGCVPSKSLILKFPNKSIFKDISLIKHFIRGYWDGDGCLSWANKEHTYADISVLGTEQFLIELQKNLPLKINYRLYNNNSDKNITKIFQVHGKPAFELCYYLYNDANIYLDRKYEKYLEYCRIYEESYVLLQVKNGKFKIENSVLNSEIKESESV